MRMVEKLAQNSLYVIAPGKFPDCALKPANDVIQLPWNT